LAVNILAGSCTMLGRCNGCGLEPMEIPVFMPVTVPMEGSSICTGRSDFVSSVGKRAEVVEGEIGTGDGSFPGASVVFSLGAGGCASGCISTGRSVGSTSMALDVAVLMSAVTTSKSLLAVAGAPFVFAQKRRGPATLDL
jgi:hypothetical protein